ncbi:MAG: hypothetical protein AB1489_43570 [Acidobacteriota bacterium]
MRITILIILCFVSIALFAGRSKDLRVKKTRPTSELCTQTEVVTEGYMPDIYEATGTVYTKTIGILNRKTFLTTENNQHYQFQIIVPRALINELHLGNEVVVKIDALNSKLTAKIVAIVPVADTLSGKIIVKLDLPNSFQLRSGMLGRAEILTGYKLTTTITTAAIHVYDQYTVVYVMDEQNDVKSRLIQIGKAHGDRVEILSGLNTGERVVVNKIKSD